MKALDTIRPYAVRLPALAAEIEVACRARSDRDALVGVRRVAELALRGLAKQGDVQLPARVALDELRVALLKSGHLPERLGPHIQTIQHHGNVGAHASVEADATHVAAAVVALCALLDWLSEGSTDHRPERPGLASRIWVAAACAVLVAVVGAGYLALHPRAHPTPDADGAGHTQRGAVVRASPPQTDSELGGRDLGGARNPPQDWIPPTGVPTSNLEVDATSIDTAGDPDAVAVVVRLHVRGPSGWRVAAADELLRVGTPLRFEVVSQESAWLYLLQVTESGESAVIFPEGPDHVRMDGGRAVQIPAVDPPLFVQPPAGRETFVWLLTSEPVDVWAVLDLPRRGTTGDLLAALEQTRGIVTRTRPAPSPVPGATFEFAISRLAGHHVAAMGTFTFTTVEH